MLRNSNFKWKGWLIYMIFNIKFWSMEKYLPTKRCRNLRQRYVKNNIDVDIKELIETDFPVAFIIHDYQSVYENAKSYDDFDGNGKYKMFSEEMRTYNGKLFKPVRISHGTAISTNFESFDYIKQRIQDYDPYWKGGEDLDLDTITEEQDFLYSIITIQTLVIKIILMLLKEKRRLHMENKLL